MSRRHSRKTTEDPQFQADASRGVAYFEYEPAFVRNPLPVSPIKKPVTKGVFSFAERLEK